MRLVIEAENHRMVLREFLTDKLSLSKRIIKKLKAHDGGICVNGVEKTVRYCLQLGDELVISFPAEEISQSLVAENLPLEIVYEDEFIIVVNKPAGIPTIPSQLHPRGTLANRVLHYYSERHIPYTIHVVTRLDKDTSGLVLIAKHHYSHSLFSNLQRRNGIVRKYKALITGQLLDLSGTIDLPIMRAANSIIERVVDSTGKHAVTHFEVLAKYQDHSLVEIELETGRTHQIRVHFSHLGNPLLGDDLYGGKLDRLNRQALHCSSLKFIHPFTEKLLEFTADIPQDMMSLME